MNSTKKDYGGIGSDEDSDRFAPEMVKQMGNEDDEEVNEKEGEAGGKNDKQSNTIIQQINGFSMTPMNDRIAE